MLELELDTDPWQSEIINDPHRVKVAIVGRRAGKSTMLYLYGIKTALEYTGIKVLFTSPTFARCKSAMKAMATTPYWSKLCRRSYSQFPMRYEMVTGSTIEFRSLDKGHYKNIKGEGIKLALFDEAALCEEEAYFECIRPMLLDTDGTACLASTYRGRNWLYHLAQQGLTPNDKVKSWVLPSSVGRRFQGPEGIKRLEQYKAECAHKPGYFEQECENQPLSGTDCVFKFVDKALFDPSQNELARFQRAEAGHRYILAADLGRTPDFGYICVLDFDTGVVVYTEQLPQVEHSIQADKVRMIADRYQATVMVDATGGAAGGHDDSHVRFYRDRIPGIREFHFSQNNKRNLVGHLDLELQTAKVKIPRTHTELIAQLKTYRYKMSDFAIFPTFGAPSGEHDDAVSALCMAAWARKNNWINSSTAMPLSSALY